MVDQLKSYHTQQAEISKQLYLEAHNPMDRAEDWKLALRTARRVIWHALRKSKYLSDISGALQDNGSHTLAFRYFLAPPISQDQFKLLCPDWSKGTEKSGRPQKSLSADAVAQAFDAGRDRQLTAWIDECRQPTIMEIRQVLLALAPLLANQDISTARRNDMAAFQEKAVIDLLQSKGWQRLPSRLIDTRAAVPEKHFMHKTRFATATARPQEVDIACGLPNTKVLAMECKVTNDQTNSIKRINDVLKKAKAWEKHWGSFVVTAAFLNGVIDPKDVHRLLDDNVQVFWSHDLDAFSKWIDMRFAG